EAIGKAILSACELASVGAIQVHTEDLADLIAHNLNQHAMVAEQQRRRIKDSHSVARGNLLQFARVQIVNPKVGRRLRVVFVKGAAGSVPSRLHAQQQHPASVREGGARLPGGLVWDIEIKVTQAT